jgi:purine-binding chemotaxis protein CheW
MKKEILSILRKRAAFMAKEPGKERFLTSTLEMVEFVIGYEKYCVDSAFVREVYQLKDFTPLPGIPEYIIGIVNRRGRILPLIDLKKFFRLQERGIGELNKVILIYYNETELGILADEVEGTKIIGLEDILPVPAAVPEISRKYFQGVTIEGMIILAAMNLLSDKSIIINDEVK